MKLHQYLTEVAGETVSLGHILKEDALKELIKNKVKPTKFEISLANVKPEAIAGAKDAITPTIASVLRGSGSPSIALTLSAKQHKQTFLKDALQSAKYLKKNAIPRVCRLDYIDQYG